jgi:hypothetical protein
MFNQRLENSIEGARLLSERNELNVRIVKQARVLAQCLRQGAAFSNVFRHHLEAALEYRVGGVFRELVEDDGHAKPRANERMKLPVKGQLPVLFRERNERVVAPSPFESLLK